MHEQLTEHFVNNLLFNPQQYGFRKKSSTELAALELIDRLLNQLNNHSIPINFYIDLSHVWCGGQEHEHVFAVSSWSYAYFAWLCMTVKFHVWLTFSLNNLEHYSTIGF